MEPASGFVVSKHRRRKDSVSLIVLSHLVAVIVCACFSLADGDLLVSHVISTWFETWCAWLILPALLAWFVCPLVMLVVVAVKPISGRSKLLGVGAEVCLVIGQYFALLPSVM